MIRKKEECRSIMNILYSPWPPAGAHIMLLTVTRFGCQVAELGKKDYAELRTFLHDVENSERIRKLHTEISRADYDYSDFVFFEDVMEKVQEREGSATVQWVLRGYADEWRQKMRARRSSYMSTRDD